MEESPMKTCHTEYVESGIEISCICGVLYSALLCRLNEGAAKVGDRVKKYTVQKHGNHNLSMQSLMMDRCRNQLQTTTHHLKHRQMIVHRQIDLLGVPCNMQ